MEPERGDVVRSVDPFKLGEERQRPWLVVKTTPTRSGRNSTSPLQSRRGNTRSRSRSTTTSGKPAVFPGTRSSRRGPYTRPGARIWSRGRGGWPTSSSTGSSPCWKRSSS